MLTAASRLCYAAGEGENFNKTGPAPPVQLPVYSFSPLQPAIRMLIIPIIAQTDSGDRCPGVQQFSYTIPVGLARRYAPVGVL